jgi:histidinol phosphatase-like PHP family hydrolase
MNNFHQDWEPVVIRSKNYALAKNKEVHFIKYPIYVGANRGRGQVYPTGEKSNNNIYLATSNGKITEINISEKGENKLTIINPEGNEITQVIPAGLKLIVEKNSLIQNALKQIIDHQLLVFCELGLDQNQSNYDN